MIFTDDNSLGYGATQRRFYAGDELKLDRNYCRAHLPLINPAHPDCIFSDGDYSSGRYERCRYSLVLPVDSVRLKNSVMFQSINDEIKRASFADKMAWEHMAEREHLLHATISSGFRESQLEDIITKTESFLASSQGMRYRLSGIFTGSVNTGRLYFKVYPQITQSGNAFHKLQSSLGLKETQFFLVGYYNFTDHLNQQETLELADIIESYKSVMLWEEHIDQLWLLSTHDDLVLSGEILQMLHPS